SRRGTGRTCAGTPAHDHTDDTDCGDARATSAPSCLRAYRRSLPYWSVPEGHSEMFQERAPLLIIGSGCVEGDVHPLRLIELLEVDLREDDLFADAEGVVAAPVERLGRHALEVAHARQRERHEPIEELVHVIAAQRHHRADLLAGAKLEDRDRLL